MQRRVQSKGRIRSTGGLVRSFRLGGHTLEAILSLRPLGRGSILAIPREASIAAPSFAIKSIQGAPPVAELTSPRFPPIVSSRLLSFFRFLALRYTAQCSKSSYRISTCFIGFEGIVQTDI